MTKPDSEAFCYIATWPACGCIRFVTADEPDMATANAKNIARCVKAGYTVNRVTVADFKAGKHGNFGCADKENCPNPHAKRKAMRAK